jgi:NosR/NirI family transcriptional regulator, nitrous oxide reductase regulator
LKKAIYINLCLTLILMAFLPAPVPAQQQRFPQPEFQTEYQIPQTSTPEPRAPGMEYIDLLVLIGVMAFTTWLVLKKRSRSYIFWVAVLALVYFGFYRNGCICPIGAIQNVSLALFDKDYAVPLSVLAFFALPLLFTLFAGRIFCASACPLGVIQDLVIIKPIKLAPWLQKTLGLFPFIYLGLAVLYAATGTSFIICRYDPFIGIFRMGAEFHMVILGIGFLLIGMFVARPYCRFICPYGALLGIGSRYSKNHLSITPAECISCRLCENACPFDAIDVPSEEKSSSPTKNDTRKFILYAALLPVLIFAGGWSVSGSYKLLSKAHPDVYLANLLVARPEAMNDTSNLDIETFLASGKTIDILVDEARVIQQKFRKGGWFLGGFIGLVIGITLLRQVIYRKRLIYEANRTKCYSCGRCMEYCPVGRPEHPYHHDNYQAGSHNSKSDNNK